MPPSSPPLRQVHGTVVALAGRGVLLRGRPGSGKSDLALRLIESGGRLVADDRVDLSLRRGRVVAAAPRALAGLIEARGVGIVAVPRRARAPIALVADLTDRGRVERMPAPDRCVLLGVLLPRVRLAPFEASAPIKLRLALARALSGAFARASASRKKRRTP